MTSFFRITSTVIMAMIGRVPLTSTTLSSPALSLYTQGIDPLHEGRWPDAVVAFSCAFDMSGDAPDIGFARGDANTLAEDFPRAKKDIKRASQLSLDSRGKGREICHQTATVNA